jgi:hypothetical protein
MARRGKASETHPCWRGHGGVKELRVRKGDGEGTRRKCGGAGCSRCGRVLQLNRSNQTAAIQNRLMSQSSLASYSVIRNNVTSSVLKQSMMIAIKDAMTKVQWILLSSSSERSDQKTWKKDDWQKLVDQIRRLTHALVPPSAHFWSSLLLLGCAQ